MDSENSNIARPQGRRYHELDSLRGLAAISVMLFHYTFGYDNGLHHFYPNKFYFTYGSLGVNLFFLISGFVIFMTLEKTKKPSDFIVSRLSRLYPAYWTAIILTIAFTTLVPTTLNLNIYSFKQVFVNFTMLQHWVKIADVDGAYWTLAIELTFYVIMCLLFVVGWLKHINLIVLFWLCISLISQIVDLPVKNYLNQLFILPYAPLFAGGIIFYQIKAHGSSIQKHLLVVLSLIIESFFLYKANLTITPMLIVIGFYVVFYLFIFNKLRILGHPILLFMGSISYTMYLIHEKIGVAIIYHIKLVCDSQIIYIPVTCAIIIVVAALITKYIEIPAMKWIRTAYKQYQSK